VTVLDQDGRADIVLAKRIGNFIDGKDDSLPLRDFGQALELDMERLIDELIAAGYVECYTPTDARGAGAGDQGGREGRGGTPARYGRASGVSA
jgi:hypothetical protein